MKIRNYLVFAAALFFTSGIAADGTPDSSAQDRYPPTAEQMILDGLIYRPISLGATLIGTGIFIATLPFSLIGGNADEAGERLILEPASNTFERCLGCLPQHSYSDFRRE
jgi:hypothetical protein